MFVLFPDLHYRTYHLLNSIVLVLAGIELIFFTVADMGLWFRFVLKTVLIIH